MMKWDTTTAKMHKNNAIVAFAVLAAMGSACAISAHAASSTGAIYTDSLQNGWQSWPWAKTVKLDNSAPIHSGSKSILVVGTAWQALSLNRTKTSSLGFKALSFWIYGSGPTPQPIKVVGLTNNKAQKTVVLTPIAPKSWRHITLPLSQLGVANSPNLTGFWIQDAGGKGISVVVDDVSLTP